MATMKYSFDNKASLRQFVMPLMILVLALLGTYFVSLYSTFFTAHKFLTPVSIMVNLRIDVFGALLPLFIGLACVILYLRQGGEKMTYALCFLFSLAIALTVTHVTAVGLVINQAIILFGVSSMVVFFVPFSKWLKKKSVWALKRSYVSSLLVAASCIPFSLILADLYYNHFFINAVIGGNGLADGVLLATMYSPFTIALLALIFSLVFRTGSQVNAGRRM